MLTSFTLILVSFNIAIAQTYFRFALNNNCKYKTDSDFKWIGKCKNGYAHGFGTIYWCDKNGNKTGNKYIGNVWYGKNQGYGIQYYSDGSIYYKGYWSNDKKNGQGTIYYSNGSKYVGNWENDNRSGYGEYYWSDGSYYKGKWSNDRRNGYGKEVSASGTVYEGYFENGKFIGSSSTTFSYIASDKYGYATLSSGQTSYWKYYVPANTMGVFT